MRHSDVGNICAPDVVRVPSSDIFQKVWEYLVLEIRCTGLWARINSLQSHLPHVSGDTLVINCLLSELYKLMCYFSVSVKRALCVDFINLVFDVNFLLANWYWLVVQASS